MRARWLAILTAGCGVDDAPPTPQQAYEALEARVGIECGSYENKTPADEMPPPFLCGAQPAIGCINDAIAGTTIARLEYRFRDASFRYRQFDYYAGDGKLVWIGFFDNTYTEPSWYYSHCRTLELTSFEAENMTCYKLAAIDCVRQSSS